MTSPRKGDHLTRNKRLTAPDTLKGKARELFGRIVSTHDATHFIVSDVPLLAQFVVASTQADVAAAALAKEGLVVNGKANPMLIVQEKSVRALAAIAPKLRLCPSARMDRYMAGSNARPQPKEIDDDEDPHGLLAR